MDGASGVGSGAIADMEAFGAPPEMIAALKAENEAGRNVVVEVEPENVDAVRLFRGMRTQWQRMQLSNGRGVVLHHLGFNYASLPAVADALDLKVDARLFDDFQFMEATALAIYARRDKEALSKAC